LKNLKIKNLKIKNLTTFLFLSKIVKKLKKKNLNAQKELISSA